ncbi:MAG: DNA polymerase III subunit chi [Rhodospirillaceae bacterium]
MTEISFYHLLHTPLERALPKLMEKVLESGERAVIRTGSAERAESICGVLWTYDKETFLPHGTARDGHAADQPLWITPEDENPNGAAFLVLTDGAETAEMSRYARCFDLFDGRDDEAVAAARKRWTSRKAEGHGLTYWQQTPRGGWEKQR